MKTKMIFIVSFFVAGIILTSFQKDKSAEIFNKSAIEQMTPNHKEAVSLNSAEFIFNYPNPFKKTTTIYYFVPKSSWVTLDIKNLTKMYVTRLVSEYKPAGNYQIVFDSQRHSPGQYEIEMRIGNRIFVKSITKISSNESGTVFGKN